MQLPAAARVVFSELTDADADFILRLTNSEGWLRFIGDRGIRSPGDARHYIESGPRAMYRDHRHGLWRISRVGDPTAIGLCGLIRRDTLPDPDLGFAFLPEFGGKGFALEAARACVAHASAALKWERLLAIVQADNAASLRLLHGLGFVAMPEAANAATAPGSAASEDASRLLQLQLRLGAN